MRLATRATTVTAIAIASVGIVGAADAGGTVDDTGGSAADYWTPARVASSQPRDLVVDERGLGYLRRADGSLEPYGHSIAAAARPLTTTPVAGARRAPSPSSGPTTRSVSFASMTPAAGDVIGSSATFEARIASSTGVRQATALVGVSGGGYQSFRMSYVGTEAGAQIWQVNLQGFTAGDWSWYVEVRDGGPKGGARVDSPTVAFTVDTGGGGGTGDVIVDGHWTAGGQVEQSAGRIRFSMPGGNYWCSGTAVTDTATGRSIILTAAHCVYDEVNDVFASNVMFIPNQDDGGSDGSDSNCGNDRFGCWTIDHGVVDINWADGEWFTNAAWDYGYYVVSDTGAHSGATQTSEALDEVVGTLDVSFAAPTTGQAATALGYSGSQDPLFRYCQEPLGIINGSANYWLDSCALTGGSSGGPWMQPLDGGNGTIVSVNSWGYTTRDGMAGPKLHGTSAELLFQVANCSGFGPLGNGYVVDPANPPACDGTPPPTGGLTLTIVDAYKQKGSKVGVLEWSGAEGTDVVIYRDGNAVTTTANDGSYTDRTGEKGGGTTTWTVCEADSATCASASHTW